MLNISDHQVRAFRRKILAFYRKAGRSLPWRATDDPYCITVSEIMLQQTQVERVVPKYKSWIKRWPNWKKLAQARPGELLHAWSGLGYNRRALFLGRLTHAICEEYNGLLPREAELLRKLPGIGPYTANAILIFAFNRPLVTIDTNIRKVFLHEFHPSGNISKAQLVRLAEQVLPRRNSRDWHNALMDYGSLALPRSIEGIQPLSRQSRFAGSLRQIRGEIVRQLTIKRSVTINQIARTTARTHQDVRSAARALERDGMVIVSGNIVKLK